MVNMNVFNHNIYMYLFLSCNLETCEYNLVMEIYTETPVRWCTEVTELIKDPFFIVQVNKDILPEILKKILVGQSAKIDIEFKIISKLFLARFWGLR